MTKAHVAIACGGTGGHVFPGLAIAEKLIRSGCDVTLLISQRKIDRRACAAVAGKIPIVELPAYPLTIEGFFRFLKGASQSLKSCFSCFRGKPLHAVFSTGGFASLSPVLYGKLRGARIYIHESNSIPGKANKFLSHLSDMVFVGLETTAQFFPAGKTIITGTPVRPAFFHLYQPQCRLQLGLDPFRQTLLIAGGSQGAHAINELVLSAIDIFKKNLSDWQFLHVTGQDDFEIISEAYKNSGLKAKVYDFTDDMHTLVGAATVAVSRAGASFLSELAAAKVPPVLIPYPYAADNHQFYNALTFVIAGAARMLEENKATPDLLVGMIKQLSEDSQFRNESIQALDRLCVPDSADKIGDSIIEGIKKKFGAKVTFEPSDSVFDAKSGNSNKTILKSINPVFVK